MKNRKNMNRCVALFLAVLMLLPYVGGVTVKAGTNPKQLEVMFLNDTHSHLDSFLTVEDGEKVVLGGFARIKTVIKERLQKNKNTVILDGGDFSMGTLVQTVFETQAAELRMLGDLGCDVTTLGNHEFDYRSKGLANMLSAAKESGDVIPAMVISNVDWEAMEAQGLSEGQQSIKDAFLEYGVRDYVVATKGDVKIAVFGIFGDYALDCAPTCELLFQDQVEASKQVVEEIKQKEEVDMIVCVSHSGTSDNEKKSEDEILAKEVPDIDLIVSGHTHTLLEEPILHGDTYIVSCGEYGKHLGTMSMEQKENGRWALQEYELVPITENLAEDAKTKDKIAGFMECVDDTYLSQFGYTKDQVLATNDVAFTELDDLLELHEEQNLGNIVADGYAYAVEQLPQFAGDEVDATVIPGGVIRDTYAIGDITVRDVYNSFSLGIGEDGIPGYPLISIYLTGKELKTVAEIDASISDFMTTARLYCYGLGFTYNPHRIILNKVTDCFLLKDGGRTEIEDEQLYHVVADLYSGQMLSTVTDLSYGLLSIVPKNADGTPITDFSDVIVYDQGKEVKAWAAIASYIESFEDTDGDGIAKVPESYAVKQGRKNVELSRNPWKLLRNPNKFSLIIMAVAVIFIALAIRIIIFCFNKKKRREKRNER